MQKECGILNNYGIQPKAAQISFTQPISHWPQHGAQIKGGPLHYFAIQK